MILVPGTVLYSVEHIRQFELIAERDFGLSASELMENAGKASYEALKEFWPNARRICVVCGGGNNGGDGYVLARLAHLDGMNVTIWDLSDAPAKEPARTAKENAKRCNVLFDTDISNVDVIVDAIFGIGLRGDFLEPYAQKAIGKINSSGMSVLSLDCPSGLSMQNGNIISEAVCADLTITFLGYKTGLYIGMAPDYTGKIICSKLGLPELAFSGLKGDCTTFTFDNLKALIHPRSRLSHKGDNGHVLIIGGDYGFAGAVIMAAEAALRTGAGLVSVATRKEHVSCAITYRPEIMCHAIEDADSVQYLLDKATVIVLGPGLGQSDWSQMMFNAVKKISKPIVLDADGLNLLAKNPQHIGNNYVLTPHPGEAARLLNCSTHEIQNDRLKAMRNISAAYGGCVALKGAGTLIAGVNGIITLCEYGNPGMGSGGMGDVLSGVIGGLLAQGFDAELATILGVYVHSYAADILAREEGERGILATDLIPCIRSLLN